MCLPPIVVAALLAAPSVDAGWNSAEEPLFEHPTWIYIPSSTMPNGKRALLLALHGCAQTHTELKDWGNLVSTADAKGVVLALPSVGSQVWSGNPSAKCWDYDGANDGKGHIMELVKLANALKGRSPLNIDPSHVYIVGLSSGAALALDVGCKAPDLFAGVGAVAGPSVGSLQFSALADGGTISSTNVSNAINKCNSLADSKSSFFAAQIANIAYGEMDKNGENPGCNYTAGSTSCAGQYALVSKKWSTDNVEVLRSIYGTGALGTPSPVQGGTGEHRLATQDGKVRISLLRVDNVGHAWPAGSGETNNALRGGVWMAQSGLNYIDYAVNWLTANNLRAGNPEVTANASVSGTTINASGTASDSDGSITSIDTALLKANSSNVFEPFANHSNISFDSNGSYSDSYSGLATGWYKVKVTVTDNTNRTGTTATPEVGVGNPSPLWQCRQFTSNNYAHAQRGRAQQCNMGYTCANGSNQNMGLYNLFITTTLRELSSGYFEIGACP